MMPRNISETDEGPAASAEVKSPPPVAERLTPPPVAASPDGSRKRKLPLTGVVALVIALGVGAYACSLQLKLGRTITLLQHTIQTVDQIEAKTSTAQAKALEATTKSGEIGNRVTALESRVENKFHNLDDYLSKTLPAELKKIATLEARMIEDGKTASSRHTAANARLNEVQLLVQTNDTRIGTIIQVIRNQDRILRNLLPPTEAKP